MGLLFRIKNYLRTLQNQNYELIWAKTWDDTKKGMAWIDDLPGVSPGRWAVGYNYLYVMTRVLNEKKPLNILDLGLGISSTLISQYYKGNNISDGIHDVIEQDGGWIDFYNSTKRISDITNIHQVELVEKDYKGVKYYAYKDISNIVANKKYDVISIDGPWGSPKHSRRDIIEYIPSILSDSFVIIMDDSQRDGEGATVKEIKNKLKEHGIDYCEGLYPGMTHCTVIVSADNKFICSM